MVANIITNYTRMGHKTWPITDLMIPLSAPVSLYIGFEDPPPHLPHLNYHVI